MYTQDWEALLILHDGTRRFREWVPLKRLSGVEPPELTEPEDPF